jgi:hypothetical protein
MCLSFPCLQSGSGDGVGRSGDGLSNRGDVRMHRLTPSLLTALPLAGRESVTARSDQPRDRGPLRGPPKVYFLVTLGIFRRFGSDPYLSPGSSPMATVAGHRIIIALIHAWSQRSGWRCPRLSTRAGAVARILIGENDDASTVIPGYLDWGLLGARPSGHDTPGLPGPRPRPGCA